jgi:hypothetical protein
LDPGGFGAVTITKTITIDGGYNMAGIVVAATHGIIVNAASDDVVIQYLVGVGDKRRANPVSRGHSHPGHRERQPHACKCAVREADS